MKKHRGFGNVILILIFLAIGGGLGFHGGKSMVARYLTQPVSLDELDYENLEGAYVKTTIYYIYDWFVETVDSKNRTESREYIIDGDDYYYLGMLASGSQMKKADRLVAASADYYDYKIDEDDLQVFQYEVVGTIEKMPSDSIKYYKDYIGWSSMTAEQQEPFLMYYLVVDKVGGSSLFTALLFCGGGLIFAFLGLKTLLKYLTGYDRAVKKFIASANTPGLEEKVKSFLEHTDEFYGLQVSKDFIFNVSDGLNYYLDQSSNLIWAYKSITTHRTNGIKTGTTYSVIFKFMNKKTFTVSVKREDDCHDLLQRIAAYCPKAIYGYDAELEKLYNKNLTEFLNIRYYNIETVADNTSPDHS